MRKTAIHSSKPYEFIWDTAIHGPKLSTVQPCGKYEFIDVQAQGS